MSETQESGSVTRVERSLALGLLVAVILLQLFLSQSWQVFSRNFWLDEVHTFLTVSDPDWSHAMQALAHGVNGSPPTYFVALRAFSALLPFLSTEVTYRLFSLLCMIAALWFVYILLRKSISPLAAFTAVLALWAHPLILRNAFEARFYALWLLLTAVYAYVLASREDNHKPWGHAVVMMVVAALLCTVHYFGIFTWALITCADFLVRGRGWLQRIKTYIPTLAGPCMLLLSVPLLISQAESLGEVNHMDPVSIPRLLRFAGVLFPVTHLTALALLWGVGQLDIFRPPKNGVCRSTSAVWAGLLSLSLLPFILIALSLFIQPMMAPRYTLATTLAIAAVMALMLRGMGKLLTITALVTYLCLGAVGLHVFGQNSHVRDGNTLRLMEAINGVDAKTPVMFEITRDLSVVVHYAPDLAARCFFLDFTDGELNGAGRFRGAVRNVAILTEEYYTYPALMHWDRVKLLDRFYLVPGHRTPGALGEIESDYSGYDAQSVDHNLVLMTRLEAVNTPRTLDDER